jgi:hypothetical protein
MASSCLRLDAPVLGPQRAEDAAERRAAALGGAGAGSMLGSGQGGPRRAASAYRGFECPCGGRQRQGREGARGRGGRAGAVPGAAGKAGRALVRGVKGWNIGGSTAGVGSKSGMRWGLWPPRLQPSAIATSHQRLEERAHAGGGRPVRRRAVRAGGREGWQGGGHLRGARAASERPAGPPEGWQDRGPTAARRPLFDSSRRG